MDQPKFKRIQCIDRALDILQIVASGNSRTIAELAAAAGLNNATAYNIVKTLMARGFITGNNGFYQIGSTLDLMAQKWDVRTELPQLVRPMLLEIARRLHNDHVSVSMQSGGRVETAMLMPDSPGKYNSQFLRRVWDDPLFTASGRVLTAFHDEKFWMKTIERHLEHGTPNLLEKDWDPYRFYKHLEEIRSRSRVTMRIQNTSGEITGAVAIPLFSPSGVLLGAVGASCLEEEASPEHLADMLKIIQETAAQHHHSEKQNQKGTDSWNC